MTLYFGLGKSEKVDRVAVRWPLGEMQSWSNVGANRTIGLMEGSEVVKSQAWKR